MGGAGADSLIFSSGADLDNQLRFRVVLTTTPLSSLQSLRAQHSIFGGGGADTMVFNSTVGGANSLDSGADSVSFVTLVSGATMHGGGGSQTMPSALLAATFWWNFAGGYISLGAGNDNITFTPFWCNSSTITGTGHSDTIHFSQASIQSSLISEPARPPKSASVQVPTWLPSTELLTLHLSWRRLRTP